MFNIYSFIKITFYELVKSPKGSNNPNQHNYKCEQLFISTHNFEVYNLIYDWFIKTDKKTYFTITKINNSTAKKDESVLSKTDKLILDYKSEYTYLFSLIYEFQQNAIGDFESLHYLPNIIRKFVETYLNFKYLTAKSIEDNISSLIKDDLECEKARKFMHYYSHNLTTDSIIKFPNLSECKEVVDIVLKAIEIDDITHYNSLKDTHINSKKQNNF